MHCKIIKLKPGNMETRLKFYVFAFFLQVRLIFIFITHCQIGQGQLILQLIILFLIRKKRWQIKHRHVVSSIGQHSCYKPVQLGRRKCLGWFAKFQNSSIHSALELIKKHGTDYSTIVSHLQSMKKFQKAEDVSRVNCQSEALDNVSPLAASFQT